MFDLHKINSTRQQHQNEVIHKRTERKREAAAKKEKIDHGIEKTKTPKATINKHTHSIIFQRILIYHIDIDGASCRML